MSNPFVGNTHISAAERAEHEDDLIAKRIVEIPSNMQGRWAYDVNNLCTFAGYAPMGLSESSTGWLLHKYEYTGTNCVKRTIAYDSWANAQTTASYS